MVMAMTCLVASAHGEKTRGPEDSGEQYAGAASLSWGEASLRHPLISSASDRSANSPVNQARRLVNNFNLREKMDATGRVLARERLDGTREKLLYSRQSGWLEVWVTSQDGKFQEERLYQDNRLQAVLLVDGSLRTLQYFQPGVPDPESPARGRERALTVVQRIRQRTSILEYDRQGKLLAGYLPDGTKILTQAQPTAGELERIINPDFLRWRDSGQ